MSTRQAGDRVAHSQYGHGTVQSVNEYHTVIEFDEHGKRTFQSPRVVLTDSMVPAPEKPVRAKRAAPRAKKTAV
jgi:hypothetical protein